MSCRIAGSAHQCAGREQAPITVLENGACPRRQLQERATFAYLPNLALYRVSASEAVTAVTSLPFDYRIIGTPRKAPLLGSAPWGTDGQKIALNGQKIALTAIT